MSEDDGGWGGGFVTAGEWEGQMAKQSSLLLWMNRD